MYSGTSLLRSVCRPMHCSVSRYNTANMLTVCRPMHCSVSGYNTENMLTVWWPNIVAKVNACGVANRTVEDIKKKWKDLKSAPLNSVRSQTKTGGGPPVKPTPFAELVLNVIGDQSCFVRYSGLATAGRTHRQMRWHVENWRSTHCRCSMANVLRSKDSLQSGCHPKRALTHGQRSVFIWTRKMFTISIFLQQTKLAEGETFSGKIYSMCINHNTIMSFLPHPTSFSAFSKLPVSQICTSSCI